MKDNVLITTDTDKCVGCNMCIRVCQMPSANSAKIIDGVNRVEINSEYCINCDKCLDVCSHGVRKYKDDTAKLFEDLQIGRNVTLLVALSIVTNILNYKKLFCYLKSKGVKAIYDVSFGADIIKYGGMKIERI